MRANIQPKELINKLLDIQLENENYVFRGISKLEQNNPSIKRVRGNREEGIFDLSHDEIGILYDFMHLGSPYFNKSLDTLDYVAIAQHYDVPTRFIDWTFDPYVALYFAIVREKEPDDGLFRIYYTDISENIVIRNVTDIQPLKKLSIGQLRPIEHFKRFIDTIENDQKSFVECIIDLAKFNKNNGIHDDYFRIDRIMNVDEMQYNYELKDLLTSKLIFFNAAQTNDRLIAQQGLFSISKSLRDNDPREEIENGSKCFEFALTETGREKAIKYLEKMNYKQSRLFPELASLGNSLREQKLIESKAKILEE